MGATLFLIVVLSAGLILLLLFSRVEFYIISNKNGNNIHIRFLHIFRYNIFGSKRNKGTDLSKWSFPFGFNDKIIKKIQKRKAFLDPKSILKILLQKKGAVIDVLSKISLKADVKCTFFLENPMVTAMLYGVLHALIANLNLVLYTLLAKYDISTRVIPSFSNEQNSIEAQFIFSVRVVALLSFGFKMMPILIKYKNTLKKGGALNGSSN